MEDEVAFFKSFVVRSRQERYINLISTKTGRAKLRTYIAHFRDLDSKCCTPLDNNVKTEIELISLLKSKGATKYCHVISEDSTFDTQQLELTEAVNKLFRSGIAYFLLCIPGKLGYYEGEDRNSSYLLEKN